MINLEQKISDFTEWYNQQLPYHQRAIEHCGSLIKRIPEVIEVNARIKSIDGCVSKFKRKYLPNLEPDTPFNIQSYISDLVGLRAVCYYSEDVTAIKKAIKKYFRVIDITDKTRQMEQTDNKFGYKSLHLQLALKKKKDASKDLIEISQIAFELQIRTVIQDAWSVLDHKIKYKKSIPQYLKRRINRLSALFEIADEEFLNIYKEIVLEEKKIKDRLKRKATSDNAVPLDVFRFLFIALKHFPDYKFIEYKVDNFVQEILNIKEGFTEENLDRAITKHLAIVDKIEVNLNQKLNPYTKIKYCLYLFNKDLFANILSEFQKDKIKGYK
jgi:putative GTP pyrophosphokinase